MSESAERQELGNLLEFEIQRIIESEKQPGWTKWALAGSCGALIWTAWTIYLDADSSFAVTSYLVVALLLLIDLFLILRSLISGDTKNGKRRSRFRASSAFHNFSKSASVVTLLTYVLALLVIWTNEFFRTPLDRSLASLACAVPILADSVALALGYLDVPVLVSGSFSGQKSNMVGTLLTAISGGAVLTVARPLLTRSLDPSVDEWRAAILVAVAIFLFGRFFHRHPEAPLLSTLHDIRRQVGLNDISIDVARTQTEIALKGLTIPQVLQQPADRALRAIRSLVRDFHNIVQEVDALQVTTNIEDNEVRERKKAANRPIIQSIRVRLEKMPLLKSDADRAIEDLLKRRRWLEGWLGSNEETSQFMDEFSENIKEQMRVVENASEIRARIES